MWNINLPQKSAAHVCETYRVVTAGGRSAGKEDSSPVTHARLVPPLENRLRDRNRNIGRDAKLRNKRNAGWDP